MNSENKIILSFILIIFLIFILLVIVNFSNKDNAYIMTKCKKINKKYVAIEVAGNIYNEEYYGCYECNNKMKNDNNFNCDIMLKNNEAGYCCKHLTSFSADCCSYSQICNTDMDGNEYCNDVCDKYVYTRNSFIKNIIYDISYEIINKDKTGTCLIKKKCDNTYNSNICLQKIMDDKNDEICYVNEKKNEFNCDVNEKGKRKKTEKNVRIILELTTMLIIFGFLLIKIFKKSENNNDSNLLRNNYIQLV